MQFCFCHRKHLLHLAGWISIHSALFKMVITELVGQESNIVDGAASFIHKIHYFKSLLKDEKNCTLNSISYNGNVA